MRHASDVNFARTYGSTRILRVAFEAKVVVALVQKLGVHRSVRLMTRRAAFAEGLVLEGVRHCLLSVALGTRFALAPRDQPTTRFENVHSMRVVALRAIHPAFHDRVMFAQLELSMGLHVAVEARFRTFAWIDDEPAAAASHGHVFACGSMTRLAPGLPRHLRCLKMQPAVGAGCKNPSDIGVALETGPVADEGSTRNIRHHKSGTLGRRARTQPEKHGGKANRK